MCYTGTTTIIELRVHSKLWHLLAEKLLSGEKGGCQVPKGSYEGESILSDIQQWSEIPYIYLLILLV
jgi:hypothetical protein